MKHIRLHWLLLLALPAVLACGLTDQVSNAVTGGDEFNAAAALWSDVPQMDGLTRDQDAELPLTVKLLMRTIIGNLGRLNPEGEDQTTGKVDWIAFDSAGTPDDVRNFYTAERMAANGWGTEAGEACASGSAEGVPGAGTVCNFTKTEAGVQKMVVIFATQGEADQPMSVFFLRMEFAETTQ